jgi:hypothetical protein
VRRYKSRILQFIGGRLNDRNEEQMIILVSFVLTIGLSCSPATVNPYQQQPLNQPPFVVEANGDECEMNSLHIRFLRGQVEQGHHTVKVVARLGDVEQGHDLNKRRLHNAQTALKRHRITSVEVTEGEKVNGLGRVEFYIDNKLFMVSIVRTGKDLCVTCCDPEKDLYPWYKPKIARQKKP